VRAASAIKASSSPSFTERSCSTNGAGTAWKNPLRKRLGSSLFHRASSATVVFAASNPAIATPCCAASHCVAATDGDPDAIFTCAAFTSSAACAV